MNIAAEKGRNAGHQAGGAQIVIALQRSPRRIDDEGHVAQKHQNGFYPPIVGTARATESPVFEGDVNRRHVSRAPAAGKGGAKFKDSAEGHAYQARLQVTSIWQWFMMKG
jgi:hypothetical protein